MANTRSRTTRKPRTPATDAPEPVKQSDMLIELRKFLGSVPNDVPYEKLADYVRDNGWVWQMRQAGPPLVSDSNFVVSFEIFIGREDTPLEYVDFASVMVPASVQYAEVSLAARLQIPRTILYMFFGRLPPAPPAQATQAPEPEPDPQPRTRQNGVEKPEWHEEPAPAVTADTGPNVVDHNTPDGIPVFIDLFSSDEPSGPLIDRVLSEIEQALPAIGSEAGIRALYNENRDAMAFVKDLGEQSQRSRLKTMIDERRAQLEATH